MNSVERVKSICKSRKIPISRLEKELNYANGYIGQLRKGTFPYNRLVEIANYLDVPISELTGEEAENKKSPTPEGAELRADDIRALLSKMTTAEIASLMADAAEILKQRG